MERAATAEPMNIREHAIRLIRQMRAEIASGKVNREKMDALTDDIEYITMEQIIPSANIGWFSWGLTRTESCLADALFSKPGRLLSKSALFEALYFNNSSEDVPDIKIIDIYICKLRGKFSGTKYQIETIYGLGYRGVIHSGLPDPAPASGYGRCLAFDEIWHSVPVTADELDFLNYVEAASGKPVSIKGRVTRAGRSFTRLALYSVMDRVANSGCGIIIRRASGFYWTEPREQEITP